MSVTGPVARGQGAIMAFQSVMGELVCAVAEQQERAEIAEARAGELERELDRVRREEYRRGYSTGHSAGSRGAPAEPDAARANRRGAFRVVEGERVA